MAVSEFVDGAEAARLLGIKRATLYAYVSRGLLQSYRQGIGRHRLYRRSEIDTLREIHLPEEDLILPPPIFDEDDVFRDVHLPMAESWVGDH